MTSVVSTVAGGLETPDFLELRKGRTVSEAAESYGPRSLYQVVPEKQTNVRGLMGSERGYDVSAVAGAPIPVLGDERGTKVRFRIIFSQISWLNNPHAHVEKSKRRGCYIGRRRVGRSFRGRVTPQVRCPCSWKRRCSWSGESRRGLLGYGGEGNGKEKTKDGPRSREGQERRQGVQVLTCFLYLRDLWYSRATSSSSFLLVLFINIAYTLRILKHYFKCETKNVKACIKRM